jgi:hypothetical protein
MACFLACLPGRKRGNRPPEPLPPSLKGLDAEWIKKAQSNHPAGLLRCFICPPPLSENSIFKTNVLAKLFAEKVFKPLHEPVNGVFAFKPRRGEYAVGEIVGDPESDLLIAVMVGVWATELGLPTFEVRVSVRLARLVVYYASGLRTRERTSPVGRKSHDPKACSRNR